MVTGPGMAVKATPIVRPVVMAGSTSKPVALHLKSKNLADRANIESWHEREPGVGEMAIGNVQVARMPVAQTNVTLPLDRL